MKSILTTIAATFALTLSLFAAEPAPKELIAADDARVAATLAIDKAAMEKIFTDDLRYAHSNGNVDTKQSFIETLTSGKNKYLKLDYIERNFSLTSPDVALMTGQVRVKTESAAKGTNEFTLIFLGVWKLENGTWKFHAWQSARLPEPAPAN
jgi:ketosteroid isomerase-like protein